VRDRLLHRKGGGRSPPAERGLTKFEALSCERWNEAWEAYPALDHVHVGYVDARSFAGRAIVVDVEEDFDRWARLVDPLVDEFGDPVPNEEADDRITLNLQLPTAKRLIRLLQKAVAELARLRGLGWNEMKKRLRINRSS
jgi:hypothetical protein